MEEFDEEWTRSNTDVFWGEISPCEHLLQIYDNDEEIIDSLENFSDNGFKANESVIIIATAAHLKSLDKKLKKKKHDLKSLKRSGQYICLDAEEVLSQFMRTGWPDEKLFNKAVNGILLKARGENMRKVRAYGEMVAILWAQGYNGATVQLEHLWNKLCEKEKFSLFCAYPKSGFTQDIQKSIAHICSEHSKIVSGKKTTSDMQYRDLKINPK